MPEYKAPLRDMRFVLNELLGGEQHYGSLIRGEALTPDLLEAILSEAAKFAENVLSPLNSIGDEHGCKLVDGHVTTPPGFKEAYQQFVEGGWPSLAATADTGGQDLPPSLAVLVSEMTGSANWSWGMYPGLSAAAVRCITAHGDKMLKDVYLTKLVEGSWTGSMCLTEPHCGSDLGLLRTKAQPNPDGTYSISGTKIFISGGDHDMTDNIVHLVIARVDGAPEGTKGITLFIVPKYMVNEDGTLGDANGVSCGAVEKKMGIKGSATCVMNFDGAIGYMVGEENNGLNHMFTMMNVARMGTAMQGLCAAETSFQGALEYARERLQMRSLTGPKNPDAAADPIIVHPDVRRMLLTQKAFGEGSRALIYWLAMLADTADRGPEDARQEADDLLQFLTPIGKAFCTEVGYESANLGVQVFGGHGYISEHGMEQIVRDARISMLYEGTTGIQALDLLGRKVFGSGGALLAGFTKVVHRFCKERAEVPQMQEFIEVLAQKNKIYGDVTAELGTKAAENADEAGAASVDYLMFGGYVVLAFLWAQMAEVAMRKLAEGTDEKAFYEAKIKTARFYYQRILPRTLTHYEGMQSGADNLMSLEAENFSF